MDTETQLAIAIRALSEAVGEANCQCPHAVPHIMRALAEAREAQSFAINKLAVRPEAETAGAIDPDHYLTQPMENQEAIHGREIDRLNRELIQLQGKNTATSVADLVAAYMEKQEAENANLKRLMRRAIPTIDSRETDYGDEFKAACR